MANGKKAHGEAGHTHAPSADADRRYLGAALALLSVFLVFEVVLAIEAGSLALLSDAGHMLTDLGSLVFALIAIRLAARPAQGNYTFGFKRAEILSAQANGVTLLVLGAWFAFEGVRRLIDPPEVKGGLVLAVAVVGIGVNLIATVLLNRANRTSLNVEGAYQHILTDLYAFIGTALAGLIVLATGWVRADSIAALVVAAVMIRSGVLLLVQSSRVLLEAAPAGVDPAAVAAAMTAVPGVHDVHDLHIWEVTSGFPSLSAHVLVSEGHDCHQVRLEIQRALAGDFDVAHSTLQVDHATDHAATLGAGACCVDEHLPLASTHEVADQ